MADVVSPLDEHRAAGRFGLGDQPGISLSEVRGLWLLQLAAWPETIKQVGEAAAGALGVSSPPGPGRAMTVDNKTLLRVEPLKWWLIAEDPAGIARPTIPPEDGNLLDLSHSRTWLKADGDKADRLLNNFLPIDLRSDAFSAGSVASTAFHHVGVTLWRGEDGFNLFLPRSFALSLWQMLEASALQYGLAVDSGQDH